MDYSDTDLSNLDLSNLFYALNAADLSGAQLCDSGTACKGEEIRFIGADCTDVQFLQCNPILISLKVRK